MVTVLKAPVDGKLGHCKYGLPATDGVQIEICRKAFMNVFGLGSVKLTNLIKRMTNRYHINSSNPDNDEIAVDAVANIGSDGRGKSKVNVWNRTSDAILDMARDLIRSQLVEHGVTSHYVSEKYSDIIFMPPDQSPDSLWCTLLRKHDQVSFQQLENSIRMEENLGVKFKPIITKRRFQKLFSEEFGYVRFYRPKTDECKQCLMLKTSLEAMDSDDPARLKLQQKFNEHRRAGQLGYRMIEHDTVQCRLTREIQPDDRTKWVDTLIFDHQKKFDVPHLVTKQARFGHQLSTFNFGVYSGHHDRHHFHVRSEVDGNCGSDEVITCLLYTIERLSDELGSGILNLICDSCGGQNKNQFMIAFAAELTRKESPFQRFLEVNLKFPCVGHTFLPNDRIFGVISQYVMRQNFYQPHQLVSLIQKSFDPTKPQYVKYMDRTTFKNYGAHAASLYKILAAPALGIDSTPVKKLALRDDAQWLNFGRHGGIILVKCGSGPAYRRTNRGGNIEL